MINSYIINNRSNLFVKSQISILMSRVNKFHFSKFNLKLICRYYNYNHKLYKHLFKKLIFTFDLNLKSASSLKRSLSSIFSLIFSNILIKITYLYLLKSSYSFSQTLLSSLLLLLLSIAIYIHFINYYYQILIL